MSYRATILKVSDGTLTDVEMPYDWIKSKDFTDRFWWHEGNYSCDCNRAMLVRDPDESCGHERFRVRIILPDGSVPYDEITPAGEWIAR